jgi:hypothetical protein
MWILFLFSFQAFAANTVIEPKQVEPIDSEEMELANDCKRLAEDMGVADKKFPLGEIKSINGLVTWRASRCEKRPEGKGVVTRLCEADLLSGKGLFFWQMKTREGRLSQGFFVCD